MLILSNAAKFLEVKMPSFRWPYLVQDLVLAKEVVSTRPFKATEWDQVAQKLSFTFSTPQREVVLKGRGCRERLNRLIQKYKFEDARALKRLDIINC